MGGGVYSIVEWRRGEGGLNEKGGRTWAEGERDVNGKGGREGIKKWREGKAKWKKREKEFFYTQGLCVFIFLCFAFSSDQPSFLPFFPSPLKFHPLLDPSFPLPSAI